MEIFIIYAVVLFVYIFFPSWLKVLVFIINIFIPDAVPVVDEAIMAVTILATLKS